MMASMEARELRRLAKEMLLDCEAELKIEKQTAAGAAERITTLEDQVKHLEGELREGEKAHSKLIAHVETLEATSAALEREKAVDLQRRLKRALSDLDEVSRVASSERAAAAEAREQSKELRRENAVLAQQVKGLTAERDDLQGRENRLHRRMERAQQESAARIAKLRDELSESRSQVRAILSGISLVQDTHEA